MILKIDALIDSNVVIAMLSQAHEHHGPSLNLFIKGGSAVFAVAAHSYAEAFSTLTRRGERAPFKFTPKEAWASLESVRAVTQLVGLSGPQTFDAIRRYAESDGVGARRYDRLIGEVAAQNGIPQIVTWNIAHMRGLFPDLRVATPLAFAAGRP